MLKVERHTGTEFVFGRRGGMMVLLLPDDGTIQDAITKFRMHLAPDEMQAFYLYAQTGAAA